ncbi:MAG: hemerythrin family protein [Fidelibacterota bacterium]|nr:MAG: hemerythrin family protein [Candidatus Neomarinimicrobiota bacterium]
MEQELPPIITWDNAWDIGHPEIDEHHHKLVEMLQRLFGAIITAQGEDYVKEILVELIEYTKYHFKREEEVFAEHGFDRLSEHKELHQDLIRQVLDVSEDIIVQGATDEISDEVYYFLRHWLADHIIKEDLKFKTFLASKS